jgi:hypothetical protein
MYRGLLVCLMSLLTLPTTVRAEMLTFTSRVVANYDLSLLGGTPLNPGPTTPFIPFQAVGDLTFQLAPSLNDPSATTAPFVNVTGMLQGVPPSPADTLPHFISPDVQFLSGSLTNIVRDANGNVISADVSDLSSRWELVSTSPSFPVTLYTQEGLPFSANDVSIPFLPGTVLAGAAEFNVYLDEGLGNNNPLVAIGRDRTLTVTSPEPSSAVLLGVGAVATIMATSFRRGKRRLRYA